MTLRIKQERIDDKIDEELDSVESFEKSENKRKRKFKDIDEKIPESLDPRKTKMVVEFNDHE